MNKSPQSTLIKTCSHCGLPKPLSAFLQLSGASGAIYGNICSTCRKTNKDKSSTFSADEGSGANKTGYKIDIKAKVQGDRDKKLSREHIKELEQVERENTEIEKELHVEKKQNIAKSEKKHRESFLRKSSFLDSKNKTTANSSAPENQATMREETKRQDAKREEAKKVVDYTKPVLDTNVTGQIKHHSSVFNTMKAWLGKPTDFAKNVEKMGLNKQTSGAVTPEKTIRSNPSSKKR